MKLFRAPFWNSYHGDITENYSWELDIFRKARRFEDGLTFFNLNVNFDKYACDHNPRFEMELIVLNCKIFEFVVYNVWHIEHEQSPYYGLSEAEVPLVAICRPRKNFYMGKPVYWYELLDGDEVPASHIIPMGFLRLEETKFFEFGGTHEEAVKTLSQHDYSVVEGKEL